MEVVDYREEFWLPLNRFWRKMGLAFAREPQVFRWKFLVAPAARRGRSLFRVVLDQGEVAGTMGFTEMPIFVQGQRLQSCAFNDWYLLPRLLGKGIGSELFHHFLVRSSQIKLHMLSTPPSMRVALRNGFEELTGFATYSQIYSWTRTALEFVRRKLSRGNRAYFRKPRAMTSLLERLAGIDLEVMPLRADEESANRFLLRCQMQYPAACGRDYEYLAWHYLEHPFDIGAIFQLVDDNGELRAIFALVWRVQGLRDFLLLADVYYDRKRPEDLRRVLRFHHQAALGLGADARSFYTGNAELARAAMESGMTHQVDYLNAFLNTTELAMSAANSHQWYTSGGDTDYVK